MTQQDKVFKIDSPLTIQYGWTIDGKPKIFFLNLNIYRNFNRFSLGDAKKAYTELMSEPVSKLPVFSKLEITYVLFTGSKRKIDMMNICSIVDKFFCDVLTSQGKIIDDNTSVITKINIEFGGIDKSNPRVEIYLKEIV